MYLERDAANRKRFTDFRKNVSSKRLVYVDESGIDEYLHREYVRVPYGEQTLTRVLPKSSNFEEFLGANGAQNRSVFEYGRIEYRGDAKITGRTTVTKELY